MKVSMKWLKRYADIPVTAEEYENRTEYPVTLGEGEYFVMADRRNGGMDSRYFGTVKQDEIRGVARKNE